MSEILTDERLAEIESEFSGMSESFQTEAIEDLLAEVKARRAAEAKVDWARVEQHRRFMDAGALGFAGCVQDPTPLIRDLLAAIEKLKARP